MKLNTTIQSESPQETSIIRHLLAARNVPHMEQPIQGLHDQPTFIIEGVEPTVLWEGLQDDIVALCQ
jgi:hypothetical protein